MRIYNVPKNKFYVWYNCRVKMHFCVWCNKNIGFHVNYWIINWRQNFPFGNKETRTKAHFKIKAEKSIINFLAIFLLLLVKYVFLRKSNQSKNGKII